MSSTKQLATLTNPTKAYYNRGVAQERLIRANIYPIDSVYGRVALVAAKNGLDSIGAAIDKENQQVLVWTTKLGDALLSKISSLTLVKTDMALTSDMSHAYAASAKIAEDEARYINPDSESIAYQGQINRVANLEDAAAEARRKALTKPAKLPICFDDLVRQAIDDIRITHRG